MSQYVIAYLGGDQPSSPEEGQKQFSKYKQWLSSRGKAVVSPANPLKNTNTVNTLYTGAAVIRINKTTVYIP